MTEHELIQWLEQWVKKTTGEDTVDPVKPLESYGLSSRDAVILSGELETLLGRRLDPTIAYQYPTIAELARALTVVPERASRGRKQANISSPAERDIAIVGAAGRFPGAANTSEFWQLLIDGRVSTSPLPPGRWSEYSGDAYLKTKMAEESTDGGYLDDIASFDNEFFGLSPLEAQHMDPQQRIMLETAWEALEDAHIPADSLRGTPVGVFVGSSANDYGMLMGADPAQAHPYAGTWTTSPALTTSSSGCRRWRRSTWTRSSASCWKQLGRRWRMRTFRPTACAARRSVCSWVPARMITGC